MDDVSAIPGAMGGSSSNDHYNALEMMEEEDRAGRKLYHRNETYGYVDPNSFSAASLDKPIPSSNRGFRLLEKMGWAQGSGLGKHGTGIATPVAIADAGSGLGLGKQSEYDRYTTEATAERRKLDVEVKETEEQKKTREEGAKKEDAIKKEVKEMNREFYCELCDKQYKNVGEMANHLSSYDHHHKKRLYEAKEAEKKRAGKKFDRSKAEKKEWEAMQQRAAKAQASATAAAAASQVTSSSLSSSVANDMKRNGTTASGTAIPPLPSPPTSSAAAAVGGEMKKVEGAAPLKFGLSLGGKKTKKKGLFK